MNRFNKVIFICMGNTCRSPMAATIMTKLMPDIRVESRGMVVLFPEAIQSQGCSCGGKDTI